MHGCPTLLPEWEPSGPPDALKEANKHMRDYEAVIILDPRLEEAASKEAIERFTKLVAAKGEMTKMDSWGRRRLAYEIGHLSEGAYHVAKFKADPTLVEELDRLFKIGEEYVRAKIVRIS